MSNRRHHIGMLTALLCAVIGVARVALAAADVSEATAAELRELLGRGEYAAVQERGRKELATLSRGGRGASLEAAEILDALVVAFWRGGKALQDDAVSFAERAIEIKEHELGANHPDLATSLDNSGVLYFVRGEYEQALAFYERALAILNAADDSQRRGELGKVQSHLGPLFQELGQYTTARLYYERSLETLLELLGPEHRQVAMTKNNLATLMIKIGDYSEALRLYEESTDILEAAIGPDHPLIASAKHNLGEVKQRMGRADEAIELYESAIALKEKVLGLTHPSLALTLGNVSYLYTDQQQIDLAERLARRAVEIHEQASGAEHVDVAYSLISLGRAQAARGDFGAAQQSFERALMLRTDTLGPKNPLVVIPLYFLSEVLLQGGKPREAFELATRAETVSRDHLRLTARGAPERQALRYAQERFSSLDIALSIAAELQDPAVTRAAWDQLIRSRAAVFDEIATRQRLVIRQSDASVRGKVEDYRIATERLSNVLVRGPSAGDAGAYRQRLAMLRADKEESERALAAESASLRRRLVQQEIGYDDINATLPARAILVAYARIGGDPRSVLPDAEYIAFVLDDANDSPRIISLGSARDVESAIRAWRDEMRPITPRADDSHYHFVAESLRKLIWDPLQIDTTEQGLVLIVPSGAIHLVNFAALATSDRRFLAESDIALHYLSSERNLMLREKSRLNQQLLVIGGTEYGPTQNGAPPASPVSELAPNCNSLSEQAFAILPGTVREVSRIRSIWSATNGTSEDSLTELVEAAATEAALKRHATGKSTVHMATHGFFRANDCASAELDLVSPLRLSGLVFSRDENGLSGTGEDGILTAEEIATMNFASAHWVVLSGCDTGVGQIHVDEGILGLRRAFQTAGADTLVMSLWPAEDRFTEAFMAHLYRAKLQEKRSTAESMQYAYRNTLAMVRKWHRHSHPLYWAPFVASGDWR